jgi:hypothetical protein
MVYDNQAVLLTQDSFIFNLAGLLATTTDTTISSSNSYGGRVSYRNHRLRKTEIQPLSTQQPVLC